jgi:ribosomal protein L16 Arg81 hydroxylase
MSCRFLDNFSSQTFLAPVSEEVFRTEHWERAPFVFRRENQDYYENLFTLDDFDRQLSSSPAKIVTTEAKSKAYTRYRDESGSIPLEHVVTEMREGMTLLLEQQHRREPKLGTLCRLLQQHFGHRFETNLYLTPPHGQGLLPHWDNHDTFVMQVVGSKHWKVEKQRRKLPGRTEQISDPKREVAPDSLAFTLNQGDMIYIPRGVMHAAECGSNPSLHITVGVRAYTWEDLLNAITGAAVRRDESLRAALPLGFMQHDDVHLAHTAIPFLHKMIDERFIAAAVERFKDGVVAHATVDISGQVKSFFEPANLADNDTVGPRPGVVYTLHMGDDSVRLNFGSRNIVFPAYFHDALEFALKTPVYPVREIIGALEGDEKRAFVERLMQEGLVIRKNRNQPG